MGTRRLRAGLALPAVAGTRVALAGCILALAGCGGSVASRTLSLDQLPLVQGATIVAQARQCDRGTNAFCAIQAVLVDPRFTSSGAFVESEHRRLHSLGWTTSAGDDGDEVAADSPGHKLRVTYATALDDLIGRDENWIKRPWAIWWSLSQSVYARTPAMSIMLEVGPT
jgi:hypothetical protein